jgi:prepilin-type N-terminal cleavage/methylation domain-containing protein
MRYNEKMKHDRARQGLTLIEILIALALVVITAGIGLLALNPAGQLAASRNTTRSFDLQGIMNAVRQNIADQTTGAFSCTSGALPTTTPETMGSASGSYNIAPCLVPVYLETLPYDPVASSAYYTSNTSYNTGYTIVYNVSTTQITVAAPYAELGKIVSITR